MTAQEVEATMIGQLLTGRYLVLKKLGSGGFSETYLARDKYLPHHPLCVVKCLKLSPSSTISLETAQQLFETEARILDQLGQHHTQIPTLFAHCHEPDQVHQVQEYVEGNNLGSWLAQGRRLSNSEAIELLMSALPVLDFIHSHQVVHGDIKPSNLIRRRDGKIVLIDFGAACLLSDGDACPKSSACLAVGTPGYMPDEQHEGATRFNSDLYALGMSVIHLLTGVNPVQLQHDPISGELDWQSHLRQPVAAPFVAVLNRLVLSNARDRYQTASEVLSVLQALAAPQSDALEVAPEGGRFQSLWQHKRLLQGVAAVGLLVGLVGGANVYSRGELAIAVLSHRSEQQMQLLSDLPMPETVDQMLIAPNNQVLVTAGADHVLRLWSLPSGSMLKSLSRHTDRVTALAMSRDSRLLVSGGGDRTIRLWDVASGQLLQELRGHQAAVTALTVSPDGKTLVSGSKDGTLRLWNLQTGDSLQTLRLPQVEVTAVAYGTAGDRLISASSNQIQVWDLRTGQIHRTFAGHTAPIAGLQVVDDRTLLSFGKDRVLMWDLRREELARVFPEDAAAPITALLNRQHVTTVHDDGSVQVRTRETGQLVTTIAGKWRNVDAVLSPNHRYLACFSPDRRLRVWQVDAAIQ